MKQRILDECLALARKNYCRHPQRLQFAHFSYLIQDNVIISSGVNRGCEPSKNLGYHRKNLDGFVPKFHAEADAIKRCWRRLNSFSCVNVRLNRMLNAKLSKPCSCCHKILSALGCEECWYTTDDKWDKIKFN